MPPQLLTRITAFDKAIEEKPFDGKCAPKSLHRGVLVKISHQLTFIN
jgi:hypothetical protein